MDFCFTSVQAYNGCGAHRPTGQFVPRPSAPSSKEAKKRTKKVHAYVHSETKKMHADASSVASRSRHRQSRNCQPKPSAQPPQLPRLNTSDVHVTTMGEADLVFEDAVFEREYDDMLEAMAEDMETSDEEDAESWCDVDDASTDWETVSVDSVDSQWTDLGVPTPWKDALLKNPLAEVNMNKGQAVSKEHQSCVLETTRRADRRSTADRTQITHRRTPPLVTVLEDQDLEDVELNYFVNVAARDLDWLKRSRKSRQASGSRCKRLAAKAKARHLLETRLSQD